MGWIPDKGRAVSEAQNVGGQVSLWKPVTLGLKPVEEGTWRDAGDSAKGPVCQVLRSWDFILRKQSAFGQFLRVLNMLPC